MNDLERGHKIVLLNFQGQTKYCFKVLHALEKKTVQGTCLRGMDTGGNSNNVASGRRPLAFCIILSSMAS